MLSHLSLGVTDLARAIDFYDAVLATLGQTRVWTHERGAGYGAPGGQDKLALFARPETHPAGPGFHLALSAPSTLAVDAFYAVALAHGGRDAGAPGPRPQYGEDYYAAFVFDPDGHKLEVKARAPARTAVVTGAGRGIGRATALALGRRGHRVVCISRTADELHDVVRQVDAAGGVGVALVGDVCADGVAERLLEVAPQVHILVLNAGAYAAFGPVEATTDEALDAVFEVTLRAAFRLIRAVTPSMVQCGWGRVVLVGSRAAEIGGANQSIYAASKSALVGLCRSVAVELGGSGVTCNLVEPGLVDTERTRGALTPSVRERLVADTAVGRIGEPHEVAAAIDFLASDGAAFVTGERLDVSGGLGLGAVPRRLHS